MEDNFDASSGQLGPETTFANLRGQFLEYFAETTKENLLPLIGDAGIDSTRINFDGPVENVWDRILKEAVKSNKLSSLVTEAVKKYPDAKASFQKAFQDNQRARLISKPIDEERLKRRQSLASTCRKRIPIGLALAGMIVGAYYCSFANHCSDEFDAKFLVMYDGQPTVATTTFENPCTNKTLGFECTPSKTIDFKMPRPGEYKFLCYVGLGNQRPTNPAASDLSRQGQLAFQCSRTFVIKKSNQTVPLEFTAADKVPVQTLIP